MRIRAALLCSLLCLSHPALHAQSASYVPVALRIAPAMGEPEERLEGVLRGAIELALARGPYRLASGSGVPLGDEGAGLELGALYAAAAGRVLLRLTLSDAGGLMAPREEALEFVIDPGFDNATAEFVRSFLDEAYASLPARPAASASIALPPAGDDAPATVPPPDPARPLSAMPEAIPLRSPGRSTSLEAGLGAFVPLGEAGAYFAAAPRLNVLYGGFIGPAERWRLSAAASVMGFSVGGESGKNADNIFARIGLGLLYAFRPGAGFNPWASAETGPALVVAGAEGIGPLAKALPYLALGLGSAVRLAGSLSLVVGLSWSLFIDYGRGSISILMGLDPGLAIRLEI